MPQWSSGKCKVFEVLSGQDLSLAVAGALLASLLNKTVGAVSNCHSSQMVSARCLKSKWDLPVAGALLSLSSGEEKDLAEQKSRSCQQLPQCSSGKCKVFEVLSGQNLSLAVAGALLASL